MKTLTLEWSYRLPIMVMLCLVLILSLSSVANLRKWGKLSPWRERAKIDEGKPVWPAPVTLPFVFAFDGNGVLQEKDKSERSGNAYWWLDSGGQMIFAGGYGSTLAGPLPAKNPWRLEYAATNALDTENGYYPQNIFRLVSRTRWLNYRQSLYFQIEQDNLSKSYNRNESNGVLLFNRYLDGDNLYYAGVRVDGTAVVKKKYKGEYYTLAQVPVYSNGQAYDRKNNPNVLPKGTWLGIESQVKDLPDGRVSIELLMDKNGQGNWQTVLSAIDDGKSYGPVIDKAGYAGIRTDFMDVLFWQYRLNAI